MRNILELEPDLEVVGEAGTGREALEVVEELTPDVVLMDLGLPAPNGIETTQRLKRELPHTGVIVLANNDDEDQLFDAIKAGAAAYVLKDIDPTDLIGIIRRVRSGEYLINDKVFSKPAVASRVLKEFRELAVYGNDAQPIFAPLSPREVEILDNIAQGMTNKQVAYALSHQRADREEPHVVHPAEAVGERPHPGRRVCDAPGLDQDPRGLTDAVRRPPPHVPIGIGTGVPWPPPPVATRLCSRRHGYPRRRSSDGDRLARPGPGSPPPVREPRSSRRGSLSLCPGPDAIRSIHRPFPSGAPAQAMSGRSDGRR